MSNDVHVQRIKRNTAAEVVVSNSRSRGLKEAAADADYLFGSISPRCGGSAGMVHQPIRSGLADVDSPDQQRGDTNESDNNISSCSTLDIVNKVENLTLHQLETQVHELSQRLEQTEQQRTTLQRQLEESNAEKDLCLRRLDVVSTAHECRITEMHCVIAELSKKLRAKQDSTIIEEQEPEGSEISFQEEGSVYNSELNLTNPDAECQTDPLDERDLSAGGGEGYSNVGGVDYEDNNFGCSDAEFKLNNEHTLVKGQVEALQEEVLHLKAQIALLQSEIANSIRLTQEENLDAVVEEHQSVEYYGEDVEANESNCSLERLRFAATSHKNKQELNNLDGSPQSNYMSPFKHYKPLPSPQKAPPIAKMAERVKLRCASKTTLDNVTATDLLNSELKNADIVEHLVADLKQNNSMLESFSEPSQLDNELQRLQRKVEHLKVRNTVISLTLDESKEHCEHLYLLCGKYESNAIALQSAVNCSDRAIEAYDVMLALLESKMALIKDKSVAAEESRRAVESVARHLLDRLESEKSVCENSLGPWQNTFSIPDKASCTPWTPEDDNRLRYHVSKLKGRRAIVQNTIVNLESPFSDFYEKSRLALEEQSGGSDKDARHSKEKSAAHLDLEMAVLMQELLNLREENIVLKTQAQDADRERQYATDRIGILQEALKQVQMQLQLSADSNAALFFHQRNGMEDHRVSYSEAEHAALTEQQLVEALTRESELKGRIQTLIASVSASQKMSDEKCEQLHNNVRELQKSNLSLAQMLEQNKRKYQARIRKLEQKIMDTTLELGRQTGAGVIASNVQAAQQPQHLKCKSATTKPLLQHDNVPETTL